MALLRNDVTRAAMDGHPWVHDLATTELAGTPALYVAGTLDGRAFTTYVAGNGNDPADIERTLRSMALDPDVDNMTDAGWVDEHLAHALTMPGVERLKMLPYNGAPPTIEMVAPGIGHVSLMVDADPLAERLARIRRHRREDGEGRTLTRFGAMSLALAATDPDDLDRIVDTAFAADNVHYRGVTMQITRGTRIGTTVHTGGMLVVQDGIEIDDMPDTLKTALLGHAHDGEPLSRIVDLPGFGDLRIGTINRQTTINRTKAGGGGTWIKIHVRDEHGATFEDLEIEEARKAAQRTLGERLRMGRRE